MYNLKHLKKYRIFESLEVDDIIDLFKNYFVDEIDILPVSNSEMSEIEELVVDHISPHWNTENVRPNFCVYHLPDDLSSDFFSIDIVISEESKREKVDKFLEILPSFYEQVSKLGYRCSNRLPYGDTLPMDVIIMRINFSKMRYVVKGKKKIEGIEKMESIVNRFKEFINQEKKEDVKVEDLVDFVGDVIQSVLDIGFKSSDSFFDKERNEIIMDIKAVEEINLEELSKELLYLNPILKSEGLIASGFVIFKGKRSAEQDEEIMSDLGNLWTNHMTIDDIDTRAIKYHLNLTGEGFVFPKTDKILQDINITDRMSFRKDEYYESVFLSQILLKIIAI